MNKRTYKFSTASTDIYFDGKFSQLRALVDQKHAVIITDENVFNAHESKFRNWNTIVLKPGEEFKVQQTADAVIEQLLEMGADRTTTFVAVGGGVVTDLTGYIGAVYMRGVRFGFVPTTILAMVDASIGGKNGVDVGPYKNMVGTIRQPSFILHDHSILASLPTNEWQNGFAEIIKHACIADAAMFRTLENNSLQLYQEKKALLSALIQRNALIKIKLVQRDEFEQGERKLLNFGHTLGHALENQYELSHGQAISIGMAFAADISRQLLGFKEAGRVKSLLEQYGLPIEAAYNRKKAFAVLQKDKKRVRKQINYVLLNKIGKAVVHPISVSQLRKLIAPK
jgi:3-dehydroquinate synthase